jgi:hypothetical protein
MKKSYKFKVIPAAGEPQTFPIALATGVGSTITPALAGAQYQLIDTDTGLAPDNIRATRKGSDLHISFDGRETADLVIADFYTVSGNATPNLMGELQSGVFHPYIPESGEWARSVSQMSDGMSSIGMALGGDPLSMAEFAPAALVPMAAAGGVNPLMAAPLALLGLAGGGGGAAVRDTTPPVINSVGLFSSDDSGQSNADGITSNNKPRISGVTEAGATVKVTINGHVYTGQADAQGQFSIPVTDTLPDGVQNYTITSTDAAGNTTSVDRTLTIDTSASSTSQNVSITIDAISQDTGFSSSDFLTRDNTLTWNGKLDTANAAFNSTDWILVQLLNSQSQVVATEYVKPIQTSGVWNWTWSGQAQALADGVYTLKTQLVDTAGNPLSATPWTRNLTVDSQAASASNGQADPNAAFAPRITRLVNDTGTSSSDYLTSARQLTFTGNVARSTGTGSFDTTTGHVLTEVIDSSGKMVSYQHLTPTSTGDWTFDNTASMLGAPGAVSTYILKSMVVDNAGNELQATTQAFTVDLQAATVANPSQVASAGANEFTQMSFTANKPGVFYFNNVEQTTGYLNLNGATSFVAGAFNIQFKDTAGNVWLKTNTQTWDFQLTQSITLTTTSSSSSGAFDQGQLVGSIGKYVMTADQTLALSTLAPLAASETAIGAINHIDMHGNGAQNLTVSIADVLQLGVSNSFSNAIAFKDHLQMRVDGDAADKLTLSKLGGSSIDTWLTHGQLTLDGQSYTAYYNASKALEVFVQSSIPVTVI